jgi:hypothetical protein
MQRPLLLLDVDGVLSLFGFDPADAPAGRFVSVEGVPHLLSVDAAGHVLALLRDYELVWCTGWEERADEHLPFALGLPAGTPHLRFDDATAPGRHWKLDAIDAHAGPLRPLAWVDDGHDDGCRAWARARPGPTLLIATDPARGLTAPDRDRLLAWAGSLQGAPDQPNVP